MLVNEIGFIPKINEIYSKLGLIVKATEVYDEEVIETLRRLEDQDLTQIIEDLEKGNYLGNRKIDIDLFLNNLSEVELPTYSKAEIVLVTGEKLELPFDNKSGGVLELNSHADIKNYIINHELYKSNVVDTEAVVHEAFAGKNAFIRFRDADGKASNIERIELYVFSGSVVEQKVSYFWAKTTSALETLANRVGDIIKLGNNISEMVKLSDRVEELVDLQIEIDNLMNIHKNLKEILASKEYSKIATEKADLSSQKAQESTNSSIASKNQADIAKQQADIATQKVNLIQNIKAQGQFLPADGSFSVTYNAITNTFNFAIPKGDKGDRGDPFRVDQIGSISERANYDSQLKNFSYLATDIYLNGSNIPHIYFKLSNMAGDWTSGVPFGRGERGIQGLSGVGISNIQRTSGNGASGTTDIYTITFTDGTTSNFSVYNGKDSNIDASHLTELSETLNKSISGNTELINNHKNDKQNPHAVTKAQIDLGNVDNTADINKNVLSATKLTTPRKINGIAFDGSQDITIKDDTKVPKDGAGATGTWEINITGKSGSTDNLNSKGIFPVANNQDFNNLLETGIYDIRAGNFSGILNAPYGNYGTLFVQSTSAFVSQLYISYLGIIQTRCGVIGEPISWNPWQTYMTNESTIDAETAKKLATPRKINGIDFDGSQDIILPTATPTVAGTVKVRVAGTTAYISTGADA